MSESILLKIAVEANDGTPTGELIRNMAFARHDNAMTKPNGPMTKDSTLSVDPHKKALEKAVDLLAYLERGKFSGYLKRDVWATARTIALEILRDRAEAEAIARAEGVVE